MKAAFKYSFFALIAVILAGCGERIIELPGAKVLPIDYYWLTINFRDASGNDLIAPLGDERWKPARDHSNWAGEINPDKYKLDILLSNPHESWDNTIYNYMATEAFIPDENRPYFTIAKYNEDFKGTLTYKGEQLDGYCYLFSNFGIPAINGLQQSLTYNITCPAIFGDNLTHNIVTYWAEDKNASNNSDDETILFQYPQCTGASFDGKEIIVKSAVVYATESRQYYSYFIDIALDK